MSPTRSAGYTLLELLTVLVVVALLLSLVAPGLSGMLARARTDAALTQLTADLHYTRVQAIKSGRTAVLRTLPATGCTTAAGRRSVGLYQIVVRGDAERVVKQVVVGGGVPGLCLEMNGGDSIAFNSRGLLHGFLNRTVWAREQGANDSLTISAVGRVLRRF